MWIQRIYKKSITWYLCFLRFHFLPCYKTYSFKMYNYCWTHAVFPHFVTCTSQPSSHQKGIVFFTTSVKTNPSLQHHSTRQCSKPTTQYSNYCTLCSKVIDPQLYNQRNKNSSLATQTQNMACSHPLHFQ